MTQPQMLFVVLLANFGVSVRSNPNKSSAGFFVRYTVEFVVALPLETVQGTF